MLWFGQRLTCDDLLSATPPRSALETQADVLTRMDEEEERKAGEDEPSAPNITRNIDQVILEPR